MLFQLLLVKPEFNKLVEEIFQEKLQRKLFKSYKKINKAKLNFPILQIKIIIR